MTRKSFYRKLRKVAPKYKWKLSKDGIIRGYIGNKVYCPITAVLEQPNHVALAYHGEKLLNLSISDNMRIIKAADAEFGFYGKDVDSCKSALLRAVGLGT